MQISQRHHRLQKVEIHRRSRRRFYFQPQPQFSLPNFSDDKEAVKDVFGVFTLILSDAFEGGKSNKKGIQLKEKLKITVGVFWLPNFFLGLIKFWLFAIVCAKLSL